LIFARVPSTRYGQSAYSSNLLVKLTHLWPLSPGLQTLYGVESATGTSVISYFDEPRIDIGEGAVGRVKIARICVCACRVDRGGKADAEIAVICLRFTRKLCQVVNGAFRVSEEHRAGPFVYKQTGWTPIAEQPRPVIVADLVESFECTAKDMLRLRLELRHVLAD
jgi:hypothetical protein